VKQLKVLPPEEAMRFNQGHFFSMERKIIPSLTAISKNKTDQNI
jgi:hypothetical protein